jgi:hypothetical protein
MLSYTEVRAFLKTHLPTFRKTRLTNLALLTSGILGRRSFCLSEVARSFPGHTAHQYKLKVPEAPSSQAMPCRPASFCPPSLL